MKGYFINDFFQFASQYQRQEKNKSQALGGKKELSLEYKEEASSFKLIKNGRAL